MGLETSLESLETETKSRDSTTGKNTLKNRKILKLLVLSLIRLFPCELKSGGELQVISINLNKDLLQKELANL